MSLVLSERESGQNFCSTFVKGLPETIRPRSTSNETERINLSSFPSVEY